ncbi:MAG: GrpB family protein [Planctomycetota bacterium]|jgi:GrpB-like predicted nucleotidyltransferase (UPF0157 family)
MPAKRPALGLPEGRVLLSGYRKEWPGLFKRERTRLRRALGSRVLAVEHIGSTAVPGLAAKPVLDIALAVAALREVPKLVPPLEALGYEYKGLYGLPGRHFFVRGEPRTHHLHVVRAGGRHWRVWLLLRDYLRAHAAEAARYERFKRSRAHRFAADRPAYTSSKSGIVERMLLRAGKWARRRKS